MKYAFVKASDLSREGRWDVAFHLVREELKPRVAELEATMTSEEAVALVRSFRLPDKAGLSVLLRGTRQSSALTRDEADRVAAEYPHLSLAIVEQGAAERAELLRTKIHEDQVALEQLEALSRRRPPSDKG